MRALEKSKKCLCEFALCEKRRKTKERVLVIQIGARVSGTKRRSTDIRDCNI